MEETVALIHRAQAGDSDAYGLLVGRFQDMAYGYAYAVLNDFHLAQDAAQEAFIEAYRCLPTLHEPYAFPAWLKRIVYKHCDRLIRGKRLDNAPLDAVAEMPSTMPGPAEVAEQHDLARQVQDAIRELPVPQRTVTTLFYINGYSHQEIADFLEVPANTVKSRLHASRSRLRERMIDMVQDELKANALPEDFTKETVEQAVARAGILNKDHKYEEAEELLREVLAKSPRHTEALKELNRALMHGRVYAQSRWDLLPELANQARIVLETTEDEFVRHQLAVTLLAIPAMPEAIASLEDWIAKSGPNLERLGMLAWAKGCVADYESAEAVWHEMLALARTSDAQQVLDRVPFAAFTLENCFKSAGETSRAQHVTREAWEMCRDLGTIPFRDHYPCDETQWMMMFFEAGLETQEIAHDLIARLSGSDDPRAQGIALSIRNWFDDPDAVLKDWLRWVTGRTEAGDFGKPLELARHNIVIGLKARGLWKEEDKLASATWELLGRYDSPEAARLREQWEWELSIPQGAIRAENWALAEEIARRRIQEQGMQAGASWLLNIAIRQGLPTPADVVQAIEEGGIESVDSYGMFGWYMVAREAAAAGDEEKAFDALRKALCYWMNPPYAYQDLWGNDPLWGTLRDDPRFKEAFDERRRRIGPICGLLHYFPGW